MRFIVCGGRDYADKDFLFYALDYACAIVPITYVIQGEARGADALAKAWAKARSIPHSTEFLADWNRYGNSAGPKRNTEMLEKGKPHGVIAFPRANGLVGNGTTDMAFKATCAGLEVWWPHKHKGEF